MELGSPVRAIKYSEIRQSNNIILAPKLETGYWVLITNEIFHRVSDAIPTTIRRTRINGIR